MLLAPETMLQIYKEGTFPMADSADDPAFKICEPYERSLLPFENLHVSKSLRKRVLKGEFQVRVNTNFPEVIQACGEQNSSRKLTWINQPIKDVFNRLHRMGYAHSVECWQEDRLVGGLYGLQVGGAFCGESMFSHKTDASKVALVHLCARLSATGFSLLDAQIQNPHLDQFGQIIIPQALYLEKLAAAKALNPDFMAVKSTEMALVTHYLSNTPK